MDGEVVASGFHALLTVVYESCISGLQTMTVQNLENDAWAGKITISIDGVRALIKCEECTGQRYGGHIAVDGNDDSTDMGESFCLNAATCWITWKIDEQGM